MRSDGDARRSDGDAWRSDGDARCSDGDAWRSNGDARYIRLASYSLGSCAVESAVIRGQWVEPSSEGDVCEH